jgi:hypothetical protein
MLHLSFFEMRWVPPGASRESSLINWRREWSDEWCHAPAPLVKVDLDLLKSKTLNGRFSFHSVFPSMGASAGQRPVFAYGGSPKLQSFGNAPAGGICI